MAAMAESCAPLEAVEPEAAVLEAPPGGQEEEAAGTSQKPVMEAGAAGERDETEEAEPGRQDGQAACPAEDVSTANTVKDWKPGSRCRAVYSVDGMVYPAVVLCVKGQQCRVRYDEYNNEEELDVGSLLLPDELRGPSRGCSWKPGQASSYLDSRRRRGDQREGDRGGGRRWTQREEPNSSRVKERTGSPSEAAEASASSLLPPSSPPLPPQIGPVDPLSFIPPPPPPLPAWMFGGKDQGDGPDIGAVTNMLMLWYMCGFHTGSFLTRQRSSPPSKD